MKRTLAILLAALMVVGMLAACGNNDSAGDQSKTLTIWVEKSFSDAANAMTAKRIDSFAEKTGIKVKYEFIPAVDYMTKLNAAIEAGVVPDVTTGAAHKVLSYYPNNPYMDITELVAEIDSSRHYLDSMINGTKIEGKNYFAPYTGASAILFARKDIFEAKGVELPTTWEEVFEAAKAITDPEAGVYGYAFGCGPTDEDCENTFNMLMWANGGSLLDENGEVLTEVDNATLEALNTVVDLFKANGTPPAGTTWDPAGNNKSYLMGESAMVFNAPTLWTALQKEDANPEIFKNTVVLTPPTGKVADTLLGFQAGWSIMKDSKHVEDAEAFIRYMFEEEWYDEYISTVTPVFAPVFEGYENKAPWNDGSINQMAYEYNTRANGYYGYPAESIEDRAAIAKYYFSFPLAKMINSVVTGDATAEEAILNMYTGISDVKSTIN